MAVLLTLLALGVKGIALGPNPPAFVSPNVFKILQEKYDIRLTEDYMVQQVRIAGAN